MAIGTRSHGEEEEINPDPGRRLNCENLDHLDPARAGLWSLFFAIGHEKWVSYLYRTAQPLILAVFLPWGGSQELVV